MSWSRCVLAAQDQLLPDLVNRFDVDRLFEVPDCLAGAVGEGVHQPRLPLGQTPDFLPGCFGPRLPRCVGVLAEQGLRLGGGEVAHPQRLGLDVERRCRR